MRTIPIKFRANASEDFAGVHKGDIVYGGINAFANEIIDANGIAYEVDPATVHQLVGYDARGFEVWDGDWLTNKHGDYFTAKIHGVASNGTTAATLDDLCKI